MRYHLRRSGQGPQPRAHHGQRNPGLHPIDALARNSNVADRNDGDTPAVSQGGPSRRGTEEGAVAVEAAIIMPVLLLLMISSVEFGRAFWSYHRMLLAVEEAARYAMVYNPTNYDPSTNTIPTVTCPGVSTVNVANCAVARANAYLSAYGATGVNVSSTEDTATPPNLTITATYTFDFILPALLPYGPINLTSRVQVPGT